MFQRSMLIVQEVMLMSSVCDGSGGKVEHGNLVFPCELFYLRHTRSCACRAAGATHGHSASCLQCLGELNDDLISIDIVTAMSDVSFFNSTVVLRGSSEQSHSIHI